MVVGKWKCCLSGSESGMDPDSIGFRIPDPNPDTPPPFPPPPQQKREINDKLFFIFYFFKGLKSSLGGWMILQELQELGNPSWRSKERMVNNAGIFCIFFDTS
jgi:hypothetical protein